MRRLMVWSLTVLLTSATFGISAPRSSPPNKSRQSQRGAKSAPRIEAPGFFDLRIYERPQKGFADFKGFKLVTQEGTPDRKGNVKNWTKVEPRGFVEAARRHIMKRIDNNETHLEFETQSVHGISYQFSGTWVKEVSDVLLKGKLVKLLNGKKVAEAEAEFSMEEGD